MSTLRNDLMQRAIEKANAILSGYSDTDFRQFTYDRMVDELYTEMLRSEYGKVFPSMAETYTDFWG